MISLICLTRIDHLNFGVLTIANHNNCRVVLDGLRLVISFISESLISVVLPMGILYSLFIGRSNGFIVLPAYKSLFHMSFNWMLNANSEEADEIKRRVYRALTLK